MQLVCQGAIGLYVCNLPLQPGCSSQGCVVCSTLDGLKPPLAILGAIAAGAAVPTLARRALGRGGGGGGGGDGGDGGGGGGGDGGRSWQAGQVCVLNTLQAAFMGVSDVVQMVDRTGRVATALQRAFGTSRHSVLVGEATHEQAHARTFY